MAVGGGDHRVNQSSAKILAAIGVGIGWLGATTAVHALARNRGYWFLTPELDGPSVRASGRAWPQVLSLSVQSSIGEEVLFRLLLLTSVAHVSGSLALGVAVSAVAWVISHEPPDVRPRSCG